ncbi:tryptophan--tRNA ligase [Oceanotoga teriensis]|uniref:tryptophan--tRNA ligase n=1 Tax=Oceanotoga teriensis TaxID=515440 RepID=UPI002713B9B0|nr:tryptophan--tRNA ligase [Oceanotoga teriensis]MDO7977478.1 tryptophan--tRNA ligase [Oceanotoga teriensis]
MERKRVLTGDRPTGKLHLGHYVGSLENRVKLQQEYDCTFIIADLHMLTTKNSQENIKASGDNAVQLVLDAISAGIEPDNVKFYLQSGIPEMYEMYTLFQSLVTVSRLERLPSLKDMARDANIEMPFALLGYPILQAADILCVKSHLVPVGKDNVAHVEIAREIAKRFNSMYGEMFPIPEPMQGQEASLVGIYGKQKMSKSANNAIFLSDSSEDVKKKVMKMTTDPNRIRADIPGRVEGNPVFIYHDLFNSNKKEVEDLKERYRKGTVGDVEVKEKLSIAINNFLDPLRERRHKYEKTGMIEDIILKGTQEVRLEVQKTVYEMRKLMGFNTVQRKLNRKAEKYNKEK